MARYIDADALMAHEFKNDISYKAFCNLVKRQPTADVVPVRHGRWIDRGLEGAWNYCSECGEQAIDLYDYCPNCGAKMVDNETAFNRWAKSVADSYRKNGGDGE